MAKLPRLSGNEVKRALSKAGFDEVRQRGSHVILKKETLSGKIGTVVPMHEELKIGTLKGILELAKIDEDEFSNYL